MTCMSIRYRLIILLLLFISLWGLDTAVSHAQSANGLTLNARAGYDGIYKPNRWVPVQITVANNGPAVEGQLSITLGSVATADKVVYNTLISLPTQSNKQVTLYVYLPQFTGNVTIELHDADGRLLATAASNKLTQLATDGVLYGIVTPSPGSLDYLQDVTGQRSEAAVAYLSLDELPDAPSAWNALDVLVFHDVDTAQLSGTQQEALDAWVDMGGQLVVVGSPNWQKTAVPLADRLPVSLIGSESIADLPALSTAVGQPFRDPGPYLVATSSLRSGELLLHQDGLPLLARQAQGRGAAYFLALDPTLAPLVDWDGSPLLWAEIANRLPQLSPWADGVRNVYAANTAVSSLPSLALPSVLQLVFYLLLYIIVIGPVNYLVLKRRNRRELAWATIPALVVLFSGIAYLTGFQLKGNEAIVNQMSVAIGAVNSDNLQVQSILGLYSPRRHTYDIVLPPSAMARPLTGGFGDAPTVEAITRGSNLTLTNVRVDVSGIESFLVDSVQPSPAVSGQAALNVRDGNLELAATVRNESDLLLENATLLVGDTAVSLGNLPPNTEVSQTQIIGVAGLAGTATGAPALSFGPSIGSPLTTNAAIILGISDYYSDPVAYPRWQILQALEAEYPGAATLTTAPAVTLLAWSDRPQIEATLNTLSDTGQAATTLYMLEIPLIRQLADEQITIPATLLNWEILADSGLYLQTIQNFYLGPSSWVEVNYQPWPELQAMDITYLSVMVQENATSGSAAPTAAAWDWSTERWTPLPEKAWGETAVSNFQPFIGPQNRVRLRLENNSPDSLEIATFYPILQGRLRP